MMFQELGDKLDNVFRKLKGHGKLTEKNISDTMREVRRVLLEADVNFKVAKQFINNVRERALGQDVLKSITPAQMVIKIINDELTALMGEKSEPLQLGSRIPACIMLCGLQGSGKTTLAGKLANHLRKKNRNPLLVAADIYRPAAVDQLKIIGEQLNIPVYSEDIKDAVKISTHAAGYARKNMLDTLILDTAGRLHIDDNMMQELEALKKAVKPEEILFVADAMTGQDAVNTANQFLERLDFTGVVLTKLDGDARGGAALSIRAVTEIPIKFVSVGEKLNQLEPFYPERMASRILGMGDVVSLVEKAQDTIDTQEAEKLEKKLRKQQFTLEDFYDQLQQIKKMGPLQDILAMMPGANNKAMKNLNVDDKALVHIEAIINSMTPKERHSPNILNGSRRKRIAVGSGTSVQQVNRLLNQFDMMKKMMKQMNKSGGKMRMPLGF
ncbi:MAG: signal recognition particle protein [candidate division KSB1 bacterium]|nr:signal recognition particle protein [candidate division KSB1 bacterium]